MRVTEPHAIFFTENKMKTILFGLAIALAPATAFAADTPTKACCCCKDMKDCCCDKKGDEKHEHPEGQH
jgi:hypothetical protein